MADEPAVPVVIRFEPRWSTWISERSWHPSQSLRPLPGGALELRMEVGGTEELCSWILSFGGGAEVLEPASLRGDVERELRAALARYASGTKPAARKRSSSRSSATRAR